MKVNLCREVRVILCVVFRKELRQAHGGQELLLDDCTATANVIRETVGGYVVRHQRRGTWTRRHCDL